MKSSRRLEHETLRNVEVTWLPGRLSPDHKTIADFRKDNGEAIREVCVRFVDVCRQIRLLTVASVAIEGLKFEAVNNRDRNFTKAKMQRRKDQIATSVARHVEQLDRTDRQEPSPAMEARKVRLSEKISELEEEMQRLKNIRTEMALSVLAYNLMRVINILGVNPIIQAIRAVDQPFSASNIAHSPPIPDPTASQAAPPPSTEENGRSR